MREMVVVNTTRSWPEPPFVARVQGWFAVFNPVSATKATSRRC